MSPAAVPKITREPSGKVIRLASRPGPKTRLMAPRVRVIRWSDGAPKAPPGTENVAARAVAVAPEPVKARVSAAPNPRAWSGVIVSKV